MEKKPDEVQSAESEVTNDVRYQEFTEMTLDWLFDGTSVRGHFSFMGLLDQGKNKRSG